MLAFVASAEYVPRNLFAADLSYSDRPNFHGVHQKLHFVHQQSNGISQSLALKPKNFKQKIQQKRFLEGFSSIAFFFQVLCVQCSSVGILQRPTAGSSGTMPKTPWILSKKTVFFFNQKIGSHTVFGTILNFLRNEWPECTILKCSENFLAEPHNKQKKQHEYLQWHHFHQPTTCGPTMLTIDRNFREHKNHGWQVRSISPYHPPRSFRLKPRPNLHTFRIKR